MSEAEPPAHGSILCRGVLVDMDGSTIDSNPIVEITWGEFCGRYGFDLQELLVFSHGRLAIDTIRHYLPNLPVEEQESMLAAMVAKEVTMNDLVQPIPGADRFLSALDEQGIPWALVTSASYEIAEVRFRNTGLPWPAVALTAEDVTVGKPNPEGYLSAASHLGLSANECVVFEDATPGIRAGLNAGAAVIVVGENHDPEVATLPHIGDFTSMRVVAHAPGLFELSW